MLTKAPIYKTIKMQLFFNYEPLCRHNEDVSHYVLNDNKT